MSTNKRKQSREQFAVLKTVYTIRVAESGTDPQVEMEGLNVRGRRTRFTINLDWNGWRLLHRRMGEKWAKVRPGMVQEIEATDRTVAQ